MSITPGKIVLVIPSDMHDMLTKHIAKRYQLERDDLIKSDEEMQNILNVNVPPHEKVKQFTEELYKFRSLLETMLVKVKIHQQAERVKPYYDISTQESITKEINGSIVQGLAKANLKKGSIL